MTGVESLSLDTQSVMEIPSTLSLSGGVAVPPAEGVGRDLGSAVGECLPLLSISVLRKSGFQGANAALPRLFPRRTS